MLQQRGSLVTHRTASWSTLAGVHSCGHPQGKIVDMLFAQSAMTQAGPLSGECADIADVPDIQIMELLQCPNGKHARQTTAILYPILCEEDLSNQSVFTQRAILHLKPEHFSRSGSSNGVPGSLAGMSHTRHEAHACSEVSTQAAKRVKSSDKLSHKSAGIYAVM